MAKRLMADKKFNLVDTGGWMPGGTELDAKVSRQVEEAAKTASLVLFVVDTAVGVTDDDEQIGVLPNSNFSRIQRSK